MDSPGEKPVLSGAEGSPARGTTLILEIESGFFYVKIILPFNFLRLLKSSLKNKRFQQIKPLYKQFQ